jgi:hypothetical protein
VTTLSWTQLARDRSNRSLARVEPVSVSTGNSCGENVCRDQRPGRHFRRHPPIPGDRDRAIPGLRRQSHGKLKAIPPTPGNRICAGLRGGARRTQTDNQPVMSLKAIRSTTAVGLLVRRLFGSIAVPSIGHRLRKRCHRGSCGPVPSMIAAHVRGGLNARGFRRRMRLCTYRRILLNAPADHAAQQILG